MRNLISKNLQMMMGFALAGIAVSTFADEQPQEPRNISETLVNTNVSPKSTVVKSSFDAQSFSDAGFQGPAPVKLGPVYVYPTVALSYGFDDNVTRTKDNPVSSQGMVVTPSLVADVVRDGDRYVLGYNGRFLRYFDSSQDSYNTHEVQLQAQNNYSARLNSLLLANVIYSADPRGTTDRTDNTDLSRFRQMGLKGLLGYGAEGAQGRLELEASATDKRYLNNRSSTALFDLDAYTLGGRFYYRIAPLTRLLFEAGATQFDYLAAASQQDNTELRTYVGAAWDASALVSGTVKVGLMNKSFKTAPIKDYRGFSYDARLEWLPLSYSKVGFSALRTTTDSSGLGDYLLDNAYGVVWTHQWSNYLETRVGSNLTFSDYQGKNLNRKDRLYAATLGMDYKLTRYLKLGAEARYDGRNSNIDANDYQRSVIMLKASGSL